MKRYLITGITGFAGPHLARLLQEQGHEVVGLVRGSNGNQTNMLDLLLPEELDKIAFVFGDLVSAESMDKAIKAAGHLDGVFHLAAQSHPPTSFEQPGWTFRVNALGTVNLVNTVVKAGLHKAPGFFFMNCSTSEVYGVVDADWGLIHEDFPLAPMNPYGVSKAAADLYVRERAKSLQANFFCTRAFSHTGPRRGHMFSIASDARQIAAIKLGMQDPVIRVGNLSSRRVVMDVRDTVRAYYMLAMADQSEVAGEAFNVGGLADRDLYSMGELLNKMLKIGDVEAATVVDPKLYRPIDIPLQVCDTDKMVAITGFQPEVSMDVTLRDLLIWWAAKLTEAV